MKQKGIVGTIVLVIIGLVVLFLINDAFLAKPYRITGEKVIAPFQANQMVLAERVTYLFRKPSIGDRVIFDPLNQDTYATHIGIVTKIDNKNGVTTYNIISVVGSHEPWTVSADKIIRKIYFPFIDSSETIKVALSLQPATTPQPSPTPVVTSTDTFTYQPGEIINTNDGTKYVNSYYHFEIKCPLGWTTKENLNFTIGSGGLISCSNGKGVLHVFPFEAGYGAEIPLRVEKTPLVINGVNTEKVRWIDPKNNTVLEEWVKLKIEGKSFHFKMTYTNGQFDAKTDKDFNQILSTFKFIP